MSALTGQNGHGLCDELYLLMTQTDIFAPATAEVRLRRSARKEIGPASPALSLYSSERRPRPAWRRPAKRICKAQNNPYFFFFFLAAMMILLYARARRQNVFAGRHIMKNRR
jgi:hypothetical protein